MATRHLDYFADSAVPPPEHRNGEIADAYDAVGTRYREYADGHPDNLFDFSSRSGFADRQVWSRIDAALIELHAQGRHAIRVLDLGCGPGTWLLRVAIRARDLGFTAIEGRGVDLSPEMIALARQSAAALSDPRIGLSFDTGEILEVLEDEGRHACDLALCLFGVLNHLGPIARAQTARALAEATDGVLITTVRATGSLPSIYVSGIEQARSFHQDNDRDRLEVDLIDGRHIEMLSHLFHASEFRALFAPHCTIRELVGIDLFHSRFQPNQHWNPVVDDEPALEAELNRLEQFCATDPVLIDRAAHILLCAGPAAP